MTNDAAFSEDPEASESLPALFEETVRATDATLSPGDPLWPIVADTWISSAYSVWYGPLDPLTVDFWGRALEIQERELAPNDPQIGETTGLYVSALTRNGRGAEAEATMRASVERMRTVLPPESPQLAAAKGMLGENLVSQGRFAEAEPYLLESHAVILETVGEVQNFTVADSFARVLALYDGWGREDEAGPMREELASFTATAPALMPWPILRLVFPPEHEELRDLLDGLAGHFGYGPYSSRPGSMSTGDAAEPIAQVIELREATIPDHHPLSVLVARQLIVWSNLLSAEEDDGTRRRMIEESIPILDLLEEQIPAEVARGHAMLAELRAADGDSIAAAKHARAAWSLLAGLSGDWMLANTKVRVARCLVEQGLHEESESLLVPSYELLSEQFGAENVDATVARELLVRTYTAWGKPERAQAYAELPSERP